MVEDVERQLHEKELECAVLGQIIDELQKRLQVAERRAKDAEALRSGRANSSARCSEQLKQSEATIHKLQRRSVNDRVLLEQALRSKQQLAEQLEQERKKAAEQQVEAEQLQQENEALLRQREQAAARAEASSAERQRLQADLQQVQGELQKLQAVQRKEKQQEAGQLEFQRREAELRQSLAAEARAVQELQRRCDQLESALQLAEANLHAVQLRASQEQQQQHPAAAPAAAAAGPQEQQQEGHTLAHLWAGPVRHGNLSEQPVATPQAQLADLGDLEGSTSHFRQAGSPGQPSHEGESPVHSPGAASLRGVGGGHGEEEEDAGFCGIAAEAAGQAERYECQEPARWGGSSAGYGGHGQQQGDEVLRRQLDKLQRRCRQLQLALADAHLRHSQAAAGLQQEIKALQGDTARVQADHAAAQQQLEVLRCASAVAQSNEEALLQALEQMHGEVLDYATRMNAALELNAALLQEKRHWLEKLQGLERELESCREQLAAVWLQQARLLLLPALQSGGGEPGQLQAGAGGGSDDSLALVPAGCTHAGAGASEALVQRLVEAQAQEAALRSVLAEVRCEQLAMCKAVSSELRRVHVLEKLRVADLQEGQRLQRRAAELQQEVTRLYSALAEAKLGWG